jgi:hypothetical protein
MNTRKIRYFVFLNPELPDAYAGKKKKMPALKLAFKS